MGYNRAYVHVDEKFGYQQWWDNLRAGRVFITNGPLMKPSVEGQLPGYVFQADMGTTLELQPALTFSTRDPISYLEIIRDGRIVQEIRFDDYAKTGTLPKLSFNRSGWFLIRAVTDTPNTYRFAMTAPYYVEIGGQRRISKQAAQFFLDWVIERARQIKLADPSSRKRSSTGTAAPAISGRIWWPGRMSSKLNGDGSILRREDGDCPDFVAGRHKNGTVPFDHRTDTEIGTGSEDAAFPEER